MHFAPGHRLISAFVAYRDQHPPGHQTVKAERISKNVILPVWVNPTASYTRFNFYSAEIFLYEQKDRRVFLI